jgi:NADPH:quinone reductase-like Zn-dependent oxidoreductase
MTFGDQLRNLLNVGSQVASAKFNADVEEARANALAEAARAERAKLDAAREAAATAPDRLTFSEALAAFVNGLPSWAPVAMLAIGAAVVWRLFAPRRN